MKLKLISSSGWSFVAMLAIPGMPWLSLHRMTKSHGGTYTLRMTKILDW